MTTPVKNNGTINQLTKPGRNAFVWQWLTMSLVLVTFAGTLLYDVFDDRSRYISDEQQRLLTQASVIAANLEHQMTGTDNALKDIIHDLQDLSLTGFDLRLHALEKALPGVRTLLVIDRYGICRAANRDELLGRDFSNRDYFTVPRQQQFHNLLYVSPPFNTVLNAYVINLSRIIPSSANGFDGVVGASLDPAYFRTILSSVLYAPDMWSSIMHGDGALFMMLPDGVSQAGTNLAIPGTVFTRHQESGRTVNLFTGRSYLSGKERMVAMKTFSPPKLSMNRPLVIAVSRSMEKVLADWRRESIFKGAAFSLFVGGLLFSLVLIQRRQGATERAASEAVTQRLRAEGESKRSQEWLKTFDSVHDSICLMDADCRIIRCNRITADLAGHDITDLAGKYCWQLFHSDRSSHADCPMAEVRSTRERSTREMNLGDRWFEVSLDPILDSEGTLTGFVHVVRDITLRKKNEQVLEARMRLTEFSIGSSLEELLQRTLDEICSVTNSPIGFYHFVEDDQRTLTLQAWSTRTKEEFCTAEGHGSHYPINKAGVWVDCVSARQPVIHNDYVSLHHRKGLPEGHAPVIRELVVPVMRNDQIVAILGIGNKPDLYDETDVKITTHLADIAWELVEHKRAHEALHASEELLRQFMKHSPIYAFIKEVDDSGSRVLKASDNFLDMIGVRADEMIGKSMHELFPREFADSITADDRQVVVTQQVQRLEERFNEGYYITYKFPIPQNDGRALLAGYTIDITERRLAEESIREIQRQMLQQEKLASIGQLAAGVAHEINNPIGFISSNLATLSRYVEKYDDYLAHVEDVLRTDNAGRLPEKVDALRSTLKLGYVSSDIHHLLDDCSDGIVRVQKIVSDLKNFSRVDSATICASDLNQCLDSTINIVWNEIKYVAELTRNYGEIPLVTCNAQQLNQVFLNLLVNAAHAIQKAGREEGLIVVSTRLEGEQVVISVSDNGCGIPPDLRSRIFEPFFTTKEIGKGTGLGLSISAEIIRKHGGSISVYSDVGSGTVFTVAIPLNFLENRAEQTP